MEQDQPHGASTLFQDASVFTVDYIPDPGPYRMLQAEELAFELRPGMAGSTPGSVVCRGPPGTGKTACVRAIFSEIEALTSRFVPVYVDCRVDRTGYSILSRISLNLTGRPPAEDMDESEVTETIADHVLEHRAVLVICLDEIVCLGGKSEINHIMSVLLRMYESYPGTRVGVVATVSDLSYHLSASLDPSVFSVFHPVEIFFQPFRIGEIRGILRDRVRQGLAPRVVPVKVLDMVVERTRACGDIRVGLDLLKRAATLAEENGRRSVTREDVHAALDSLGGGDVVNER